MLCSHPPVSAVARPYAPESLRKGRAFNIPEAVALVWLIRATAPWPPGSAPSGGGNLQTPSPGQEPSLSDGKAPRSLKVRGALSEFASQVQDINSGGNFRQVCGRAPSLGGSARASSSTAYGRRIPTAASRFAPRRRKNWRWRISQNGPLARAPLKNRFFCRFLGRICVRRGPVSDRLTRLPEGNSNAGVKR